MSSFQSYEECRKELLSLLKVIRFLDTETQKKEIHSTLCHGSIIIIGTLFESFTENIIQEYIDILTVKFNNKEVTYSQLPVEITDYISKNKLNKIRKLENYHYGQVQKIIDGLIKELSDGFLINDELDGINRFSFGKHGEDEVKKIFKRVGIDITKMIMDFSNINNFFKARNEIVHPENITQAISPKTEDIREYIIFFYFYIKTVNSCLKNELMLFNS
jgi:hypothetical protein